MKVVTKADLVAIIAEECGLPKATVSKIVDCFFKTLVDVLAKGDKVSLTSYMSFATVKRKERMGFDPRNKKKIKIPAKEVVKVKLGNKLKNPCGDKCCKGKKSK